jgi:signal peptidase I
MSAVILAVAWYVLAPAQLGGRTTYVTTSGTSMQPLLHAGDLAVIRRTGDYAVGDVVAYRNHEIGTVVLHRIVSVAGNRYTLKGDHNTWLDHDRPTADDLLGEMVLRVPGVGEPLRAARAPAASVALAGMAALGVLGGRKRARRRRESNRSSLPDAPSPRHARASRSARAPHAWTGTVAAAGGAVALVSGVVAAVALVVPSAETVHHNVSFTQTGVFTYTGSAGGHEQAVYGRPAVETGDPIYLELTDAVELAFEYRVGADGRFEGGGTAALVAVLSDDAGWSRTFSLSSVRTFRGGHVDVSGTLDLAELRGVISAVERLTRVQRAAYTVAVRPEIAIDGTVAGVPIRRVFAPELAFQLDPLELQLAAVTSPEDGNVVDPTHPGRPDRVTASARVPRSFAVAGIRVPLTTLRAGSLIALVAALLVAVITLETRRLAGRRGEAASIAARYGPWLVPVHAGMPTQGRIVHVETFESLRRLAEHYGHVVLHEEGDGFDAYSVEEGGVTYRYRIANGIAP